VNWALFSATASILSLKTQGHCEEPKGREQYLTWFFSPRKRTKVWVRDEAQNKAGLKELYPIMFPMI